MKIKRHCFMMILAAFMALVIVQPAFSTYSRVITFGADLDRSQKTMTAAEFGVNLAEASVPVLDVTNAEERKYLKGLIPDNVIGNRAISSAMVEMLPVEQGIRVETKNITWVTTNMYANALVTAGVKDARVTVAAPFPVSGTAALTGVFKAVEYATGKSLGDQAKKVANEELVKTGKLGREIGKDKAAKLIMLVKERVAAEKTEDPQQIRQIVINVARDLNITLTDSQIDEVVALMQKIGKLNINVNNITGQLSHWKSEAESTIKKQPEIKSLLQRLLDTLNRLIEQVRSLILGQG